MLQRKWTLNFSLFVYLFCLALSTSPASATTPTFVPLGGGTKLYCGKDREGLFIAKLSGGDYRIVSAFQTRVRINRRISQAERDLFRFEAIGDFTNAALAEQRLSQAQELKSRFRQCRRGTLPGLGGGGLGSAGACSPIEGSGSFTRIIAGSRCVEEGSPVVEILVGQDEFCSGTVVNSRTVITAAHCFADSRGNQIPGLSVLVSSGFSNLIPALSYQIHPNYFGNSSGDVVADFDVAVITTASDLPTASIPVLMNERVQVGERSIIAGYGLTENDQSGELRAGYMIISSTQGESSIQAIYDGNGSDTCNGDSGGPLLINREGRGWLLAGTTSFGTNDRCEAIDEAHFAYLADPEIQSFLLPYLN